MQTLWQRSLMTVVMVAGQAYGLDLPAPERKVRRLHGDSGQVVDRATAEPWFSRYLPMGFSAPQVQIVVDEENATFGSRQPRVSAEFLIRDCPIVGARATLLTNEDGIPILEDYPLLVPEDLWGIPQQALLSKEQLRTAVEKFHPDSEVSYGGIVYSPGLGQFLAIFDVAPDIENFSNRHTMLVLVNAINGEVAATEPFCLEAGRIAGRLTGHALALTGPEVPCFLEERNPALPRDLAGFPVHLRQTDPRGEFWTTTDAQGRFVLTDIPDGPWTLRVLMDATCQSLRTARHAPPLALSEIAGQGSAELTIDLNDDPGDTRAGEEMIGHFAAWEFHDAARKYLDGIRSRIGVRPRLPGCPGQIFRGMTGDYRVQLYHVPIDEDTLFAGAFYSDIGAGGGGAVIAVNGPNRYYRGWSNGAVVLHESGHWLVLVLTGRPQEGGWPIGHDGAVHEFVADMFMLLYAARHHPDGIGDGLVGCHRDRGHPESFHRDVRLGRSCFPDEVNPGGPCLRETGFGIWPRQLGDTSHDASLAYAGFFWDLLDAYVRRYGKEAGVSMAEELFFRFIDKHRGGVLPAWDLWTGYVWLMLDDHPDNGGNNNPWDGSPNWDLITHALALHGLWLEPFTRGDVNGDGQLVLNDAVEVLNFLFRGGQKPACLDAVDADDNGRVELTDAVFTLKHLFLGGPPPPAPSFCGTDPTFEDRVTCAPNEPRCAGQ